MRDRDSALARNEASLLTRPTKAILASLEVPLRVALSLERARSLFPSRSVDWYPSPNEGAHKLRPNQFCVPVTCSLTFGCGFYSATRRESATLASTLANCTCGANSRDLLGQGVLSLAMLVFVHQREGALTLQHCLC